jgi:hypothetical protein
VASYCTINGIPMNLLQSKGVKITRQEIGPGVMQAWDGTGMRDTIAWKLHWAMSMVLASQMDVTAWQQLLRGDGDHWQLDANHLASSHQYSDKGANVITLSGAAALVSSGGKWGTGGKITLGTATSAVANFTGYTPSSGYTILVWHYESGVWHAYIFIATFASFICYKDGVLSTTPAWVNASYSPNIFQFFGTNSDSCAISDVVIYPFAVSTTTAAAWAIGMYALQSVQQWPTGGTVLVQGDIAGNPYASSYTAQGKAETSELDPATLAGTTTFTDNNEGLDCELIQV